MVGWVELAQLAQLAQYDLLIANWFSSLIWESQRLQHNPVRLDSLVISALILVDPT